MVYLKDYLNKDMVFFLDQESKADVLKAMTEKLAESPRILNKQALHKAVMDRESLMSTGIGLGIAIPHVKIPAVKDIIIGIGICRKGIDWESLDNRPVHIVILIAGAQDQHELYLRLLSKFILVLKNRDRRTRMIEAGDSESVLAQFENL